MDEGAPRRATPVFGSLTGILAAVPCSLFDDSILGGSCRERIVDRSYRFGVQPPSDSSCATEISTPSDLTRLAFHFPLSSSLLPTPAKPHLVAEIFLCLPDQCRAPAIISRHRTLFSCSLFSVIPDTQFPLFSLIYPVTPQYPAFLRIPPQS